MSLCVDVSLGGVIVMSLVMSEGPWLVLGQGWSDLVRVPYPAADAYECV